jgi:type I restriction enzyme M protein
LLGDSYEKFKEDEVGNIGKTTGQYFSPRCAIKFIIDDLLKPSYKDKTYDSSCGSGGFIHFLNKHVLSHSTKKQHGQFKLNIYANDKTPEIMKPLYINMFLHDIPVDNICNKNSLSSSNCKEKLESMDCIPGNPPYGMSIKANPQDYIMSIDDKNYNYWPSFMIQSKLNLVKDSTSQFIIHTINSLKVNGRFALIIDRGIINNGNENNSFQKKLRQWILTVCDLQSIILLPKGIFATTQFDTAIIYGIKKIGLVDSYNGAYKPSTPKVKYYIGNFEDSKNKTGLKVDLDNPDIELDIKDIVNKDWSLKYDDYVENLFNSMLLKGNLRQFPYVSVESMTDNFSNLLLERFNLLFEPLLDLLFDFDFLDLDLPL